MPTENIVAAAENTSFTKDDVAGLALITFAAIGVVQTGRWTFNGAKKVTEFVQNRRKDDPETPADPTAE